MSGVSPQRTAELNAQREWQMSDDRPLTRAEHEECLAKERADERRKLIVELQNLPTFSAESGGYTERVVIAEEVHALIEKLRGET